MSMNSLEKTVEANNFAVDHVVSQHGPFNPNIAELTLRNVAVATDRLTAEQFSQLDSLTQYQVKKAAQMARKIAPLDDIEYEKLPRESGDEYLYRTNIHQPLHSLQRRTDLLSLSRMGEKLSPTQEKELKKAVFLAALAFEGIAQDPAASNFAEFQNTARYFAGNAIAAQKGAEREQQRLQQDVEIEVMPGVYEVYDQVTGKLVDIGGGEEEV